MKNVSNTEAELKKKIGLLKKSVLFTRFEYWYWSIVFLLTSAEPQISTAPQDAALIRNLTMI